MPPPPIALSISIKVNVCTFIYWFDITILQNYWTHLHTVFLQIDSDVLHTVHSFKKVLNINDISIQSFTLKNQLFIGNLKQL